MSASHLPAMRATALEAAAALARYERYVRRLAATWVDMDLYHTVSAEIDRIQAWCKVLPGLAVPCSALLVSHSELVHALWRMGASDEPALAVEAARRMREHLDCIDALARRCLRLAEGFRDNAADTPAHHT